ncbi:MAG TPA: heme-binding protein [Dehalococcoidia bacterium]|nr:heme-binding protein [Dehalococcoidia bacterium]
MKSDAARRMMDAARDKATEIGKPVSVAIVDAGGNLMALERLGDAPSATVVVAEGKAVASAVMGRDSGRLEAMADSLPTIINSLMIRYGGRFVPAQGGVVVREAGSIIGAVGVSGATSDEDESIARAGAEAH